MSSSESPSVAPGVPRRTLLVVFFTVFLDLVGFGIIIPIQPFLAETLGATPTLVTWLGASFSLMTFLFAPLWGRLSDRVGRRPVMLVSIAVTAVGYTLFGFADSLAALFAARMLAGFGSGNIGTAQAIIADTTTGEGRAKGMGVIGAAFGLGFIFGPALGGALSQFGLAAPAFAAAGLAVVNWIFALVALPETYPKEARGRRSEASAHRAPLSWAALRHAGRHRHVPQLFVIFLVFTTGFSLMEQVLGLYIDRTWLHEVAGVSRSRHAAALTAYLLIVVGVTATIIQGGLIGRLVARFGERRLLTTGALLTTASFLAIPIVGAYAPYVCMLPVSFLMACGTGITNPSLMSLLSRAVDRDEQGEVLGLGQSLSALGRVLGPASAGMLFTVSPSAPFLVGAVLLASCAAVALSLGMNGSPAAAARAV